jgi:hypothetical protein
MSSGSLYTDWNSSGDTNNSIKTQNNFKSNYQYRQWLIHNTDNIITRNTQSAIQSGGCINSYTLKQPTHKYIFKNDSDNSKPFGYESSDLKDIYCSRQELDSRLNILPMTQDNQIRHGVITPN